MRSTPLSKPIAEPEKFRFIDRYQYRVCHRLLDDLVLHFHTLMMLKMEALQVAPVFGTVNIVVCVCRPCVLSAALRLGVPRCARASHACGHTT